MVQIGNLRVSSSQRPPSDSRKQRHSGPREASSSNLLQGPTQDFVASVLAVDLSDASDAELRQRLDTVTENDLAEQVELVERFAVINETIKRRLGVWRLFDSSFDHPVIDRYRNPVADLAGLDKTIAETMELVVRESKTRYFADIFLPGESYRAVEESPLAEALLFEPTDEQIAAGLLMLDGTVVEMDAGEGKTVAAAFPAVVQALRGSKVHVITANDYLALRDAEFLAPVYETLGLTVGALLVDMGDAERRSVYRSNVVYGTLREFGFDYLRDNLRHSKHDLVQGSRQVVIVDEADHALIDEARTPLIISGRPSGVSRSIFRVKRAIQDLIEEQGRTVASLSEDLTAPLDPTQNLEFAKLFLAEPSHHTVVTAIASDDRLLKKVLAIIDDSDEDGIDNRLADGLLYTVDVRREVVALTEGGSEFIEKSLGSVFDTADMNAEFAAIDADRRITLIKRRERREELYKKLSRQYGLVNQVHQMLRAYLLLQRGEDYIVSAGKVVLIDELTGRRKSDSKYQHGLQTALEAKEGVRVQPNLETLAYLTVQGFIRQYDQVSGMTGTALDSQDLFKRSYGLGAVGVQPTHVPRRVDYPPHVHATRTEKLHAVVDEVRHCHRIGRPVLIGTRTVDQSDQISLLLAQADVPHNRLNAVTNEDEDRVIRTAGSFGAVTVATNMAGRGTDILLRDDLDEWITDRFVQTIADDRRTSGHSVHIECGSEEVADRLASRLDQVGIPLRLMDTRVAVLGSGGGVSLEFGLGLHVIGTEMNESARVDRQLRGRSGRQGQHGSSRFVLSLEDWPFVHKTHRSPISEGATAREFVDEVQSSIEADEEAAGIVTSDFAQVIEWQTLNYYKARNGALENRRFGITCEEVVRECIRRLVVHLMPASELGDYQRRFDDVVESVEVDFGLDVEDLRGLGAEELVTKISEAVITRFGDVAAALSSRQYIRLVKTMYLQTGDRLWSQYLDLLQDMMLNAQLSAGDHTRAVTEFVFRAENEYGAFRENVNDEFVSRLVSFEVDDIADYDHSIILADDLESILI